MMDGYVYKILNKIEDTGNTAYVVGGAVRDYLLKRKIHDYDITTSLNPKELKKLFPNSIMVNKKMGTVTVKGIEITPYRIESAYEDGRRPSKVRFSRSLNDDLIRRDFTINAIAMGKDGNIVDKLSGRDDLDKKIIRCVGNPDRRFREDALRMLRAIRFSCQLDFRIEGKTLRSIRRNADLIYKLSTERVRDEFNKILLSDNVILGLDLLRSTGLLERIIPEYKNTYDYDQLNHHHKYDLYNHMIRVVKFSNKDLPTRLAALLHDIEKPSCQEVFADGTAHYYGHDKRSAETARRILKDLKYPKATVDKAGKYIENHMNADPNIGLRGVRRMRNKFGDDIYNFLSLLYADSVSASGEDLEKIDKLHKMLDNISQEEDFNKGNEICINGNDLINIGYKEGVKIGEALCKLKDLVELGLKNNRETLLCIAKEFQSGGNMKKYFGTDGVRGIANTELTNEFAYKLARAVGKFIEGNKRVVLGMDTRLSSPMFMASITAGLMAEGVEVDQVGVISTPGVAYITKTHGYGMGIMISASHNPYMYNGIKLIGADGYKLSDDEEIVIENMIDNLEAETYDGDKLGKVSIAKDLFNDYLIHLEGLAGDGFKGMKIAIDAGNGVMSEIAPKVFRELGAEVIKINCDSNGRYINDNTGSTAPEKIAKLTKDEDCDIGVAFDGDADRVIFADEDGNVLDGDHIICYGALCLKEEGRLSNNGVVTTSMSNGAFEKYLKDHEIELIRADVGDKYVMEAMRKNGMVLGGEKSGHIIFLDHLTMGDGLQTAIIILNMLKKRGEKASTIGKLYQDYPQVLVNADASDKIKKTYKENKNISKAIDNLLEKHPDYRILIRPSGTEKFVRIMIEGSPIGEIIVEANNLKAIIEKEN